MASAFDVSEMTIRRDLAILEEKNIVKLIHGGAIYKSAGLNTEDSSGNKYSLPREESTRLSEKRRIAEKAVSLIEDNDIIIIDSGSTTEIMGEFIQSSNPSAIICYALNILISVYRKKDYKLVFGGGYFHENTLMFESSEGVELIKKNRANKVFLSARGVSDRLGVTTADSYEIEMKKAALETSQQKILLIDSSKFDKVLSAYYCDIDDIDTVITDDKIPGKYVEHLTNKGLDLIIV